MKKKTKIKRLVFKGWFDPERDVTPLPWSCCNIRFSNVEGRLFGVPVKITLEWKEAK